MCATTDRIWSRPTKTTSCAYSTDARAPARQVADADAASRAAFRRPGGAAPKCRPSGLLLTQRLGQRTAHRDQLLRDRLQPDRRFGRRAAARAAARAAPAPGPPRAVAPPLPASAARAAATLSAMVPPSFAGAVAGVR